MALLKRRAEHSRPPIHFLLDGQPAVALTGDTLLTAILVQADAVRVSDLNGLPRGGFCLMGACQDCWVTDESGARFRACTTSVAADMKIWTSKP